MKIKGFDYFFMMKIKGVDYFFMGLFWLYNWIYVKVRMSIVIYDLRIWDFYALSSTRFFVKNTFMLYKPEVN